MHQTGTGPAVAVEERQEVTGFGKLREHLTSPAADVLIADLQRITDDVQKAQAGDTATRLRQLADYAPMLPPESLPQLVDSASALDELEEVAGRSLGQWMLARNILALVPLLMTWFSLSWATSAYRDEINHDPQKIYQPFLVLWENGFDHRVWLTFSVVAAIDSVLFLAIIAVTWIAHTRERAVQRDARLLVARIDHAVTALVSLLAQSRLAATSDPSDWAAAVQRVIDRAMQQTRELTKANQQAVARALQAIERSEQRYADLTSKSEHVIEQAGQETRAYIEQLSSKSQYVIEQAGQETREYIGQLKQESVDALRSLHEDDRQFLVTLGAEGRDLLLAASDRADELTRKQLMPTVESFRDLIDGFRGDIGQYQRGASELVNSISQIGTVADRLGTNAELFATTAQAMDAHVQAITQTQGQFAQQMTGASTEMREATLGMREATTQIQGVLTAISRDLSPQIAHMGSQVREASDSLVTAQGKLAEASTGLAKVARAWESMPKPKAGWLVAWLH